MCKKNVVYRAVLSSTIALYGLNTLKIILYFHIVLEETMSMRFYNNISNTVEWGYKYSEVFAKLPKVQV